MKKVKVLFLITAVMVTLVIAGCGVVIDVPITPSTGPVSYTHLDVYKRQD